MRAAWYERTGPAREVLEVGEMADPEPAAGEVLVRVRASGINPADTKRRAGWRGMGMDFPRVVPHTDGAGEIIAVGEGVPAGRLGERVWVWNAQGGYGGDKGRAFGTAADLIALPAAQATPMPPSLGFIEGACLGVPAVTAHRAVFADGAVEGLTILIQGGAGAVGHFAIQFARAGGARVLATVSSAAKADHALAAGADVVIDYKTEDVAERVMASTEGQGADRIVEVDFGANVETDIAVLATNGVIASYSSTRVPEPRFPYYALQGKGAVLRLVQGFRLPEQARAEAVGMIADLADRGRLQVAVAASLPLEAIAAAHEMLEGGSRIGNVVLDLDARPA